MIVAKLCDTGALLTGLVAGRHPLAPNISPKKTWEGAVGGVGAVGATRKCGTSKMAESAAAAARPPKVAMRHRVLLAAAAFTAAEFCPALTCAASSAACRSTALRTASLGPLDSRSDKRR